MANTTIPDDPFLQNLLSEAKAYKAQKQEEKKQVTASTAIPPNLPAHYLAVVPPNTLSKDTTKIWTLLNSYEDFVARFESDIHPWPRVISFCSSFGPGKKTGLDCLNWLVKYCHKNKKALPECISNSTLVTHQQQVENIVLAFKPKRGK